MAKANIKSELNRLAISIAKDLCTACMDDYILRIRLAELTWLRGCRRTDGNIFDNMGKFTRTLVS